MKYLVSLLLALSFFGMAQEASSEPAPPVVYEGISFPVLPYASHWIEVEGVRLHYYETGDPSADPILLLHGIPAWSYIWRNVMPVLEPHGRVIALDFPGFGRSDATDVYTMQAHADFLTGFVEAMGLEDITLVVQDLGSVAGLSFAAKNEDKLKGVVFMEAAVPPLFPIPFDDLASAGAAGELWGLLLTPDMSNEMVLNQNFFIEAVLQQMVLRPLSEEEKNAYRAPFPTPESRQSLLASSPAQINLYEGWDAGAFTALTQEYLDWMGQTTIPMLHLWVEPGVLNGPVTVAWVEETIANITQVKLGPGAHFIQEDYPEAIGQEIVHWLETVVE
jgi:haloalkane dehalogenase